MSPINYNNNQAILLITDKDSPVILKQYTSLVEATSINSDVFIAYHQKDNSISSYNEKSNLFIFTDNILSELGYNPLCESLLPGSNHFPLLKFYKENPNYEYYWVIEDDVRFNGDWKLWFNTFLTLTGDFFTCHICHWEEEQEWQWWLLVHPYNRVPHYKRIRSFNPIYRISNNALQHINMMLLDGWIGHHEVLIPTLLKLGGYHIYDFGGNSKYVLPDLTDRFYTSTKPNTKGFLNCGTMRYRPVFDAIGPEPNKLYHPVKDFGIDNFANKKIIRYHPTVLKLIDHINQK